MNNQRRKELGELVEELSGIRAQLEEILSSEQEAFDAMPESLQGSERGERAQDAIRELENALSSFDDIESCIEDASA